MRQQQQMYMQYGMMQGYYPYMAGYPGVMPGMGGTPS